MFLVSNFAHQTARATAREMGFKMTATLKQAERAIAMLEDFDAGNLRGYWYEGYERPWYVVESYGEKIAEQEGDSYLHRWITDEKFSATTTKHTNIVKRAWGWL